MSKYNTISFDAADTLFYIQKGLGGSYFEVLKNTKPLIVQKIYPQLLKNTLPKGRDYILMV